MKVVSSGEEDIIRRILKELQDKGISGTIQYGNTEGHEDLSIRITNTSVKDVLKLMLPESLCNHTFPIYGSKIYNIETSICVDETELSNQTLTVTDKEENKNTVSLWSKSF